MQENRARSWSTHKSGSLKEEIWDICWSLTNWLTVFQRNLKFGKFWNSVLDLMFHMVPSVSLSLVNGTTICRVGQHRKPALTPVLLLLSLFCWSSSSVVFSHENLYHMHCYCSRMCHCDVPPGPLGQHPHCSPIPWLVYFIHIYS